MLQSFEVLYSNNKRSFGKKKMKGLSNNNGEVDGLLTIDPSTSVVSLYNKTVQEENHDDDDDDQTEDATASSSGEDEEETEEEDKEKDGKKQSWKKRMQQQQKRRQRNNKQKKKNTYTTNSLVYTGRQHQSILQQLQDGTNESIIALGSFQVEIVSRVVVTAGSSVALLAGTAVLPPSKKRKLLSPHLSLSSSRVPTFKVSTNENGTTSKENVVQKEQLQHTSDAAKTGCSTTTITTSSTSRGLLHQPKKTIVRPLVSKKTALSRGLLAGNGHKNPFLKTTVPKTLPTKSIITHRPLATKTTTVAASLLASSSSNKSPPPLAAAAAATLSSKSSANDYYKHKLGNIPVPVTVARVLRPHQVDAVEFLYKALVVGNQQDNNNKGGAILADEPGLGKTLMTIAIIAAMHRNLRCKQFVVVCPSSLVTNWKNEFDKWLGRAGQPTRVVLHKGGQESVLALKQFVSAMKQQDQNGGTNNNNNKFLCSKQPNGKVLILSYDLFRLNVEELSGFASCQSFGLCVCDEAHRLKNTSGSLTLTALESLPADARLCLTATPIQNNLGEFYNLANFTRPGCLGDLNSFRKDFERPIQLAATEGAGSKRCRPGEREHGLAQSQALDKITKTFVLRRLQKDILKSMLPPRTEALLFCRPSKRQCELYHAITKSVRRGSASSAVTDALPALTLLRKVCCHPNLYNNEPSAAAVATTTSTSNAVAATTTSNASSEVALSGKLVVLESLLRSIRTNAPTDKIVVVSNYTSVLNIIESLVLEPNEFAFSRLDGTVDVQKRQALVDTFNRSAKSFCFLLSSKAGGCGLNLIGANRLVLFDPDWNPANDVQAMGRVYRQGQTKPTTVYRFFTCGTIEEVIYQRQLQKGKLATLTVDGVCGKPCADKFTQEELNDCFTLKEGCDCDTRLKAGRHWKAYDGPEGLRSQDCFDMPLLDVADSAATTLGYVRIVDDDVDESKLSLSDHHKAASFPAETSSLYDSDNEEEFEFAMATTTGVKNESSNNDCQQTNHYDSDDEEEFEF